MLRKIGYLVTLALAAGALLWAGAVSADPTVPFMSHGHDMAVADLSKAYQGGNGDIFVPVVLQETGEATHLGRYNAAGRHVLDLTTGVVHGEGVITAANGDTLDYTLYGPAAGPYTVTFSGGTGRFEDATGSVTGFLSNLTEVQQGNLLIISDDITGVGTISF